MVENMMMECLRLIIIASTVICLLFIFQFFIVLDTANEYKLYVNYQIEKHGGLTADATDAIDEYNHTQAKDRFTLVSTNSNRLEFGEEVRYEVRTELPVPFATVGDLSIKLKGTAVSMVR